jgi:hypothetical protein
MIPHFTLAEFIRSDVAIFRGIDNTLPPELEADAVLTLEMMERIRAHLSDVAGKDIPIRINSGYRSPEVNAAVRSAPTSDHPKACAVDFVAPEFGTPMEVCKALAPMISVLRIGQLIYEFGLWTHVSTLVPANPVNRIISIGHAGAFPGIVGV